jgi:hypothetical protein
MFLAIGMVLFSVAGLGFRDGLRWSWRAPVSDFKCAPMGGNFLQGGFAGLGDLRVSLTCGWTRGKNAEWRLAGGRKGGNGRVLARLFRVILVKNRALLARKCAKKRILGDSDVGG